MSLEKIYEEAKNDLDDIERRCPNFWNNLTASDVSVILKIVSQQFFATHNLLKKSDDFDREKLLSQEQMSNVMGLFQELVDNFFPMAHTQEPLGRLKIINGEEGNRLDSFQERSIDGLSARMRTLSEIINETSNLLNDTQAEINNLKRFQEQMHKVLNP